jgi:hypothetical protein
MPFSHVLPHRTHKQQSTVCSWQHVHPSNCNAVCSRMCFFAYKWKQSQLLERIRCGKKPPPPQWQFIHTLFSFLDSWPLKMGLIGCLKTLVTNSYSMLHKSHESTDLTLWCRPWFGSTCSISEPPGLAQSHSVLRTRILRWLHTFKHKI